MELSLRRVSLNIFYLHEIVLVDDKSELQHLHESLDEELRKPFYQNKVKIVRNKEREGLIRARNNGAITASGKLKYILSLLTYLIRKRLR